MNEAMIQRAIFQALARGIYPRGRMYGKPITATNTEARQALTNDENRGYLLIQNNSTADLWVFLDSPGGVTADSALVLGAGVFWEPNAVPTNAIYLRSASLTNAPVMVMSLTLPPAGAQF